MSKCAFLVFISLVFICSISKLHAEDSLRTYPKVSVHMSGSTDGFHEFGYSAIQSLEKAFAEKNVLSVKEDDYATEVVIEVREIDDNQVAVSIVILEPMSQAAVDLGSKAEVLYAGLSEEKKAELPMEGKYIREYASSEYLKQFRMLWNNYLDIVNKKDIDKFTRKIVEDYLSL